MTPGTAETGSDALSGASTEGADQEQTTPVASSEIEVAGTRVEAPTAAPTFTRMPTPAPTQTATDLATPTATATEPPLAGSATTQTIEPTSTPTPSATAPAAPVATTSPASPVLGADATLDALATQRREEQPDDVALGGSVVAASEAGRFVDTTTLQVLAASEDCAAGTRAAAAITFISLGLAPAHLVNPSAAWLASSGRAAAWLSDTLAHETPIHGSWVVTAVFIALALGIVLLAVAVAAPRYAFPPRSGIYPQSPLPDELMRFRRIQLAGLPARRRRLWSPWLTLAPADAHSSPLQRGLSAAAIGVMILTLTQTCANIHAASIVTACGS